jgi:1-phosphatidylinositol-4-phosphate 5-kinase
VAETPAADYDSSSESNNISPSPASTATTVEPSQSSHPSPIDTEAAVHEEQAVSSQPPSTPTHGATTTTTIASSPERTPYASDSESGTRSEKKKTKVKETALGELIYKGHSSYEIMNNIQLGIRVSISRITPLPAPASLSQKDYLTKTRVTFPSAGSLETPPHHFRDFKFKEYAPMVFRSIRELFGIDAGDFMLSVCGDNSLRELRTPGKSGALFYFSEDMQYIIKTVNKEEGKFLGRILKHYHAHVAAHAQNTLLVRFYGMFCVKSFSKRKIRLLVMNNVFPRDKLIVRKWDLKGSTLGRAATEEEKKKPGCIYKELDLEEPIRIGDKARDHIMECVRSDAAFLAKQNIMDYSLLLGVDSEAGWHMGIIDVLQEYNWRKMVEHNWKAMGHDKYAMSAVPPKAYASRFVEFLDKHIV